MARANEGITPDYLARHDQDAARTNTAIAEVVRHWAEDGCRLGETCVGHNLQREIDAAVSMLGEHPMAIAMANNLEAALLMLAKHAQDQPDHIRIVRGGHTYTAPVGTPIPTGEPGPAWLDVTAKRA